MNFQNDERAKQRRNIGQTRETEALRDVVPHPCRGGTRGYDVHYRIEQIRLHDQGLPTVASKAYIHRWKNQLISYRMTGNCKLKTIVGFDLFMMLQFLIAYPEADDDQIIAFIYNTTGHFFDRSQVSRRKKDLNITRKRASTEAYQAYTPRNQLKFEIFWSDPPPRGVAGVPRRRLADIDECGIELLRANKKYGCAVKGVRVSKPGNYSRSTNVTVILGIEPGDPRIPAGSRGSLENPRRWLKVNVGKTTTSDVFHKFMEYLMEDFDNNPIPNIQNEGKVFLWDNLSAHLTPQIHNSVGARQAGHEIVPRPPYRPWIAPIEFIFCQLACELRKRCHRIKTNLDLVHEIHNIVSELKGFNATFEHCGYAEN